MQQKDLEQLICWCQSFEIVRQPNSNNSNVFELESLCSSNFVIHPQSHMRVENSRPENTQKA